MRTSEATPTDQGELRARTILGARSARCGFSGPDNVVALEAKIAYPLHFFFREQLRPDLARSQFLRDGLTNLFPVSRKQYGTASHRLELTAAHLLRLWH
jgi:hypothetical protein